MAFKQDRVDKEWGPPVEGAPDSDSELDSDDDDDGPTSSFDHSDLIAAQGAPEGLQSAPMTKRCWTLDPKIGITPANWGIAAVLAVMLKPYKIAVVRLQTSGQPISHRVNRELDRLEKSIRSRWLEQGITGDCDADIPAEEDGPDKTEDVSQDM